MPGLHERNLNTSPDAVDDLVLLNDRDINERGIVNDLRNRYKDDHIYTYIGPVLLSVNPFKSINGLYTKELMNHYYGKYKFEVAPHVFASAEEAHRKLMATGINQCVLISGESGAGKTEAAKKVMEYVSKVSKDTSEYEGNPQNNRQSKLTRTVKEIKDSLLKSNPVLEAFGNAKTIRNDNSSRFGKYMEIQMDYYGTPLGGKITNYLLEKPRVVHQSKGERNFHVFYMLTNGMNQRHPMYAELGLTSSDSFSYLCDPASAKVKTLNDTELFEEMDEAMQRVGIVDAQKIDFYRVVAAVLYLGNISFETTKKRGQDACQVTSQSQQALNGAANLLSVSKSDLENALTTRSRETTIDKLASPLVKPDECNKVRDALAKALYARMFLKLVEAINLSIFTPVSELNLGVLDIYGFEIFEHNSFEQLCINYCNEKLQQYFIELTLKAEQEEYRQEGIKWKDIKYFNNKIVCDLIESKKPPGIISFLDEQITLNRDEDLSFLHKMNKQIKNPHYIIPPSNKSKPSEFVISHYAGEVKYSAEGMIDKNKDTLFRDILVLCGQKSSNQFIINMFPEGREKHNFKKPVTAGSQFVSDMNQLITNLTKCEPHYIRCIKPNDNKRSGDFNDERVTHQVQYLGLLENVRVRRAGYAYRRRYDLFVRRYKMLSNETWPKPQAHDDIQNTVHILHAAEINEDQFERGKTKIFIEKPDSLFQLERKREDAMHWVVGLIQGAFRRWKMRLHFQKMRQVAVNLLHGKKRRTYSYVLYFLGDYLHAKKNETIQQIVTTTNGGKINFADEVTLHHLGKKRRQEKQFLIITERNFIVMKSIHPQKGKPPQHEVIPFDQVEGLCFSTFADNYIILKAKPTMVKNKMTPSPSLVFESVRKSEIATIFSEAYKSSYGGDAPLQFADSLQVTVAERTGIKQIKMLSKTKMVDENLSFYEDTSIQHRNAILLEQNKNEAHVNKVAVASKLASQAELQLNTPLPDRVLAHTAVGRQGKKKRRNRRRGGY